ncbi:MAG: Rv1476 family membrane protein [Mycobacterium sp.]
MTGSSSPIAQFGPHVIPFPADIPPFVDLDAVLVDVADDGVSTPFPADVEALQQIVADAQQAGIDLKVVVVEFNPIIDTPLRDVATAVGEANPGSTVLVISPIFAGTYSRVFDRVTLEAGQDVAKTGNPVQSATNFVGALQKPDFDWTAMTIVLVVAVAAAVTVTRLLQLRSKAELSSAVVSEQVEPLD